MFLNIFSHEIWFVIRFYFYDNTRVSVVISCRGHSPNSAVTKIDFYQNPDSKNIRMFRFALNGFKFIRSEQKNEKTSVSSIQWMKNDSRFRRGLLTVSSKSVVSISEWTKVQQSTSWWIRILCSRIICHWAVTLTDGYCHRSNKFLSPECAQYTLLLFCNNNCLV